MTQKKLFFMKASENINRFFFFCLFVQFKKLRTPTQELKGQSMHMYEQILDWRLKYYGRKCHFFLEINILTNNFIDISCSI